MKAVMSFWTRPIAAQFGRAQLSRRDAMMWALSACLLRQHFARTQLITDADGARFLIDQLGLPFTEVSTALEALAGADPSFWALGKIHAYALQSEPWVHVDHDLFLLRPLPSALLARPLLGQCPESWQKRDQRNMLAYGRNEEVMAALPDLPPHFAAAARRPTQTAVNVGIIGGHALQLLAEYCASILLILASPRNQAGIQHLKDTGLGMSLIFCLEQWSLWALATARGIGLTYRFETPWYHPQTIAAAQSHGYLHLQGGLKDQPHFSAWVESQLRTEFPQSYDRVLHREAALAAVPPPRATWSPAPPTPAAPGQPGDEAHDDSFHYVCTRENTWKRHAINRWEPALS